MLLLHIVTLAFALCHASQKCTDTTVLRGGIRNSVTVLLVAVPTRLGVYADLTMSRAYAPLCDSGKTATRVAGRGRNLFASGYKRGGRDDVKDSSKKSQRCQGPMVKRARTR